MTPNNSAIIFVHGSMGCSQNWKSQVEGLSHRIKVIAVNLPGHQGTESPENPTMETYIAFLDDLLTKLKLEKVILGGQSMGGAVVLSYCLQYPEKVHGLILVGTGARLKVLPMILELAKKNVPQLVNWTKSAAFHKRTIENRNDIIEEVNRNMAQTPSQIAYSDWKICNEFDVMNRLGEIKVPTLIICGDADKLTPLKYAKYMQERIPNSVLQIIEEAGHMVMLEQPEAINKVIESFMDKILE